MLPRLLILEHSLESLESCILRDVNVPMHCERQTWSDFQVEMLRQSRFQLVIANTLGDTERATVFFRKLRQTPLATPILVVLPPSPDEELCRSTLELTDDFLLHPLREEELKLRIQRILGTQPYVSTETRDVLRSTLSMSKLMGKHPSFLRALQQVPLFAASNAPVLITGETGTGKELFAHAIHSLSSRHNGPFIPIDCGTLPEQLAENELFGHRRGAFTDAHTHQKGLAAMADGGTLFLDEVDGLSLANQAKLLRFIQEGSYRALGGDRFIRADVRIVAATNRPIEEYVRQRQFRGDLYFRLNVLRLTLSPLRERQSDSALLAQFFLGKECAAAKCGRKAFSFSALAKLETYDWPGNVRELANTIQRAVICCPGSRIMPEHIILCNELSSREEAVVVGSSSATFKVAKRRVVESFERAYLEDLLVRHQGNITRASREAGKDRRAFGRLVKKYNIGDTGFSRAG